MCVCVCCSQSLKGEKSIRVCGAELYYLPACRTVHQFDPFFLSSSLTMKLNRNMTRLLIDIPDERRWVDAIETRERSGVWEQLGTHSHVDEDIIIVSPFIIYIYIYIYLHTRCFAFRDRLDYALSLMRNITASCQFNSEANSVRCIHIYTTLSLLCILDVSASDTKFYHFKSCSNSLSDSYSPFYSIAPRSKVGP